MPLDAKEESMKPQEKCHSDFPPIYDPWLRAGSLETMEENYFLVSCVKKAAAVPAITTIIHSLDKRWYIGKEEFPETTRSRLHVIVTRRLTLVCKSLYSLAPTK